jgi:endo-1,4-beta-xylanase
VPADEPVTAQRAWRRRLPAAAAALGCLALAACGEKSATKPATITAPLRTLALEHGVAIGAATGSTFQRTDVTGDTLRAILAREFDMVWSGNWLKFSVVHPAPTTFDFSWADSMVVFAQAHGMTVRGHTFVWHNQIPAWLTGGTWTPAQVDSILASHIATVMAHFKGKVRIWDVVNEAVDDNAQRRTTFWSTALGPGYIERAFRLARAADSTALLFYNDYNIEGPGAKTDTVYAILTDLKARGVPVDGIGMQGHFIVGQVPPGPSLAANFARYAALGLKIEITELDIRMPVPATSLNLSLQAQDYRTIVGACLQTPSCDAVELSAVYDGDSWVPGTFPGQGAANLFDESFHPKPAYGAVNRLLAGK